MFLFILLLGLIPFQEPDFQELLVTENIKVSIPVGMTALTDLDIKSRYVASNLPFAAFTSSNGSTELVFTYSQNTWPDENLSFIKDFYKPSLVALHDEVIFLEDRIINVNGKEFAVFRFQSKVNPQGSSFRQQRSVERYTHILYTIVDGRTLVVNFSTPAFERQQWEPIAQKIMGSINIIN